MSLVSCKYCGKLHKRGEQCSSKPSRNRNKDYDRIYNSHRWKKLSRDIRKQHLYFCGVCGRQEGVIPRQSTQVHHITYITEDIGMAYEVDNLLPVCDTCHLVIHKENLNNKNKIEKHFKIDLEKEIEI